MKTQHKLLGNVWDKGEKPLAIHISSRYKWLRSVKETYAKVRLRLMNIHGEEL